MASEKSDKGLQAPTKGEEKKMTPAIPGNQQPAKGTPASVLQTYQATNPLSNQTFMTANKFKELFNSLNVPELFVTDIMVINQTSGGSPDGAEAVPFALLRSWGIGENEYVYIHLKFANGQLDQVGAMVQLAKSVGNDNEGNPNYYQMLINLVQATPTEFGRNFNQASVSALLFNIKSIKIAANEFVAKALSSI